MARDEIGPAHYRALFETSPEGARILAHLTLLFARPAVLEGGIDGIRKNDYRAGQRDVLEFIVEQINKANNPEPTETSNG